MHGLAESVWGGDGEAREDGEVVCFDDAVDWRVEGARAGGAVRFPAAVQAGEEGGQEARADEVGGCLLDCWFGAEVFGGADCCFDEVADEAVGVWAELSDERCQGGEERRAERLGEHV